jgi:predicted permease
MMIIGMTLSQVTLAAWDTRFVATCVGLRYLLWPLVMLGAVLVLQQFTPLAPELAMALLLLGVVPMASNVVVVAMELGIQPQKGALAVLTTTLLAPLLIPLYLGLMLRLTGLG